MPWPKGVARVEDSDTVRPTAIARVVYAKLQEYAEKTGEPLRALTERAILREVGSGWQTGEPAEPGWYIVVVTIGGQQDVEPAYWLGRWQDTSECEGEIANVTFWQPMPTAPQGNLNPAPPNRPDGP